MLTDAQIERYARHILLREVGGVGQERLLRARVALVGLGGASMWAAAWLALAGVGRLVLRDGRPVEPGDPLPLLGASDVGRPRDRALAEALPAFNPDVSTSFDPDERVDLVLLSEGRGGDENTLLLRWGRGVVLGWGPAICQKCLEKTQGPALPEEAALAGSLAASALLRRLLGLEERTAATFVLSGGEPAACEHAPSDPSVV